MFGYVRPVIGRLSEEEKELYQSAYCGLCHTMGKRHGWSARFALNYDFTFLAILLYGVEGGEEVRCVRCPAHPFRKPKSCTCGRALELAADESIILAWHKLADDVMDKGFFGRLSARFLMLVFRRAYQRAADAQPKFDLLVRQQMEKLKRLEQSRSPQLDRTADAFASILSATAGDCGGDEARARAMEHLLYHLGRWIYLMDAWDDLENDKKKGRYNPLDVRFEGNARQEREYVETTVTHSGRLVGAAANLIEFGKWSAIVDNVIYFGLPAVQSAVLDGRWKEVRKARETRK